MKKQSLLFLFSILILKIHSQTTYNQNESIVNLPLGIVYQLGPGANNSKNWTYPYSTKLTINGSIARNFEISTMAKDNEGFMLRQFSQNTNNWTKWKKLVLDDGNGNVGIGTNSPGSWRLAVNGKIRAKEIKVETGWSDFVFFKDYQLPTLEEVENHIKEKGHLKDIPSAKEVEKNGIFLGKMDSKLLQKIEELTLYTIEQEKKIKNQADKIENLELLNKKFIELQSRLEKLESN